MVSFSKKRVKLLISGIVQGVGFRPFIYKLAKKYSLDGYVLNNGEGVTIEIQGDEKHLESFMKAVRLEAPPLSRIDEILYEDIESTELRGFEIIHSSRGELHTLVSSDISMCDDCRQEMYDKSNRRYMYPFINCTNCGPRYSIINNLPYDRKNSSMLRFDMCSKCRSEYEDPTDRRYHAQPISCYECGPQLKIVNLMQETEYLKEKSIEKISINIKNGESVAVKGVGGFHLVCDATNDEAVVNLRVNKHRPTKPFAVMFKDLKSIKKHCSITSQEEALIVSKERPIVVVSQKKNSNISKFIAPNIEKIGVFLAYTPLHEILLNRVGSPIVATSANISDAPIIKDAQEIFRKMPLVVQAVLTHDRDIVNSCDDSVLLALKSQNIMLRMARGYTPKSFYLKKKSPKKILALGAHQKSTMTLIFGHNMIVSPHIGDLNSLEAFEYFQRTLETFQRFYDFKPDVIVCDKHPKYETTAWAKRYVSEHKDVSLIQLQHHYAHTLACMAEYRLQEEVLAFCFDGTGYGDDGSLWGGEVLLANSKSYKRVAHLKEFCLLGGEKAIKEPKKVALSLLFESYSLEEIFSMNLALVDSFKPQEVNTLYLMYTKSINSPKSSSIGRLFDAVYALSNHLEPIGYEGESGMILEAQASKYKSKEAYSFSIEEGIIEYKMMIDEILKEQNKKLIASKFFNTLIEIIYELSCSYKDLPLLFTGGVFQNKTLVEKVIEMCKKNNISYYIQSQTPINDGGISLGQAYYTLHNNKKGNI